MKRTQSIRSADRMNEQNLMPLKANPLFAGLDEETLCRQLEVLKAEKAFYERGEMLQSAGTPIRRFGILLSGAVQVCVDDIEGNRMIMAEVAPGVSFAESLCYLKTRESPVYIFAAEDSEVLWLFPEALFSDPTGVTASVLPETICAFSASPCSSPSTRTLSVYFPSPNSGSPRSM